MRIYRPVRSITHLAIHLSDSFFSEHRPWDIDLSGKWPFRLSAFPIYRGLFSPINSRKTPVPRPLGRGMFVFREFLLWPKFYLRIHCAVSSIVLYCITIYRESIVLTTWTKYYWNHWSFGLLSVGLLTIWVNNFLDYWPFALMKIRNINHYTVAAAGWCR